MTRGALWKDTGMVRPEIAERETQRVKLCRFEAGEQASTGIVMGDVILPLAPVFGAAKPEVPIEEIIADWDACGCAIAEYAARGGNEIPLARARLLAPLTRPQKIVAIGSNYPRPGAAAPPESLPVLFFKPPSALTGPCDPIIFPSEADLIIGEVELALVIGKAGHHIAAADAPAHIFGYMVANDVTAPDILMGKSAENPLFLQQSRGKGFRSFCPIGPWIVTADEIAFPPALLLEQHVDDFLEIVGETAQMTIPVAELLADISRAFGLEVGDIVLTGSPPPLTGKRTPLWEGAVLRSAISQVGELANPIMRA